MPSVLAAAATDHARDLDRLAAEIAGREAGPGPQNAEDATRLASCRVNRASLSGDIGELRTLLAAWRDVKTSVRIAAIGWVVRVVLAVLVLGLALGLVNGVVVVVSRVPDIVVTLAMSFVWAGAALLVRAAPGGGAAQWLKDMVLGTLGLSFLPKAAIVLAIVVAVIWIPVVRSSIGLSIYAIGSNKLAAFRSGVSVGRTKVISYVLAGLFAAVAGLSLTASTGIGTPVPGPYTLMSVAAVVLGGVSLAGGRGGLFGPIIAVMILQLIRDDMTFLRINSNLAVVAQGVILIGVVMIGSLVELRRSRA